MALFTVATSHHATLVAATVDKILITKPYGAVRVSNRGGPGTLFVRTDGVDPVSAADDTYAVLVNLEKLIFVPDTSAIDVRIISPSASAYSVEGV